ncbi:DPH4 protein [Tanacetum coccineum]
MQLANNAISQTHYSILNVKEDASHEEIRTGYKSALLISHPDKLQKPSPTTNSNHDEPQSRFLEIQTAWEILGDVKSRALYDMELRVSRQEDVIADEVELDDLIVEANGDVLELFYQCRCGDYFSLDSFELEEMGFQLLRGDKVSLQALGSANMASIVLPCGSCSLKVRLIIKNDHQP